MLYGSRTSFGKLLRIQTTGVKIRKTRYNLIIWRKPPGKPKRKNKDNMATKKSEKKTPAKKAVKETVTKKATGRKTEKTEKTEKAVKAKAPAASKKAARKASK